MISNGLDLSGRETAPGSGSSGGTALWLREVVAPRLEDLGAVGCCVPRRRRGFATYGVIPAASHPAMSSPLKYPLPATASIRSTPRLVRAARAVSANNPRSEI